MMYASRITIDYKPQKVRYHREIEMPDRLLSIEDISEHLNEGDVFGFAEKETSIMGPSLFMRVYSERDETQDEYAKRIEKQEKYNENYEKHHAKYGR